MLPFLMVQSSTGGNFTLRSEEGLGCGLHRVYYHMRAGWRFDTVADTSRRPEPQSSRQRRVFSGAKSQWQ